MHQVAVISWLDICAKEQLKRCTRESLMFGYRTACTIFLEQRKTFLTPVKVKVRRGKMISTIIDEQVSVRKDVMLP